MKSGVTIIRKKQGMKSFIKKLVELQHFSTTVGIHTGPGRLLAKYPDGTKSKINLASLAKNMETNATWIQSKDVFRDFKDGTYIMFEAGRRYSRVARYFVSLIQTKYWGELRNNIRQQVMSFITVKGQNPRSFISSIGHFASVAQKRVIIEGSSADNKQATVNVKGRNSPLSWTGALRDALNYEVRTDKSGIGQSGRDALKLSDANLVDDLIKKINRK